MGDKRWACPDAFSFFNEQHAIELPAMKLLPRKEKKNRKPRVSSTFTPSFYVRKSVQPTGAQRIAEYAIFCSSPKLIDGIPVPKSYWCTKEGVKKPVYDRARDRDYKTNDLRQPIHKANKTKETKSKLTKTRG